MKWVVGNILLCVASCSVVQFAAFPSSIKLPDSSASLAVASLPTLDSYLLGLSSQQVKGFTVKKDIFANPKVLAVFNVNDADKLAVEGPIFTLNDGGYSDRSLEEKLALVFGADRQSAVVTKDGISGSSIAHAAAGQKVDETLIKSKSSKLRQELINVYSLAAAIREGGAKFTESDAVDIFQIQIEGLVGLPSDERVAALDDIENAVSAFTAALKSTYGDESVIVEVVTNSSPIQEKGNVSENTHHIVKRDVDKDDPHPELTLVRKNNNVYYFASTDYPAVFAIFAGLVIALILGVVYTTVGMMTMDPGKDSIIYRMTTTRMKKD